MQTKLEKNTKEVGAPQSPTLPTLPQFFGRSPIVRVWTVYALLFEELYGRPPSQPPWGMFGKLFSPLIKQHGEFGTASLMIIHFNWYGTDGTDEFAYKRLASAAFPYSWVPRSADAYCLYRDSVLVGSRGSCATVEEYVKTYLKSLASYAKLKNAAEN